MLRFRAAGVSCYKEGFQKVHELSSSEENRGKG